VIPWHPHTETPAEPGTVAIIAVMLGDPPERDACLKEGLWHWINSQLVREDARFDAVPPEAISNGPSCRQCMRAWDRARVRPEGFWKKINSKRRSCNGR